MIPPFEHLAAFGILFFNENTESNTMALNAVAVESFAD